MSEQLDSLELLVKIRSEGLENLRAITDATKATQTSAKATGDSIDGLAKHLRDLGGAVKGYTADVSAAVSDMVKNQVAAAGKAAEDAEKRELNAIEKTIRALERKASLVGKSGAARAGQQQANVLGGFDGKATEEQIARVGAAFGKLNQITDSSGRSFASSLRMWIQNPLYAAGAAAEGLATSLGPAGVAILGIGVIGVAASVGLFKLASSFSASSIEAKNFAARIGTNTTFAQEFNLSMQRSGVSGEALAAGMRKLSQGLAEGGEQGKIAAESLAKIGVHARTLTGELRPMEEIIPEVIHGLLGVTDFADQQVLTLNILGRSYRELVPGMKEYEENLKKIKESGAVITPDAIKDGEEYFKKITDLGNAWTALVNKMGQKAVGLIEVTGILDFVKGAAKDATENHGGGAVDLLSGVVGMGIDRLRGVKSVLPHGNYGPTFNPEDPQYLKNKSQQEARENEVRAAGARRVDSIIAGTDPQAAVKAAQDKVNATLKDLETSRDSPNATGKNSIDNLQKRLGLEMASLKNAQANVKFVEAEKAMHDLLVESLAKELFGIQRINAENAKRIGDIDKHQDPGKQAQLVRESYGIRQNEIDKFNATQATADQKASQAVQNQIAAASAGLDKLKGQRASILAITNGRLDPDSPGGIEQAAKDRQGGINDAFRDDMRPVAGLRANAATEKNPDERRRMNSEADKLSIAADTKQKEASYASETERQRALDALAVKRHQEDISAEKQIAAIQAEGRKSQDTRDSQRAAILAGLQDAAHPGSPVASAQRILQQRLSDANKNASATEGSISDRENDKSLTADQAKVERAKALKTLADEKGEAELKYEEQIAELQKKRIEEYKTQAHELAGALLTRGGLAPFVTSQIKGAGQTVLGNALQPVVKNLGESLAGSVGGQRDANGQPTGIGKLLQGTFLAPHDEQKITLTANTTSIDLNTAATDKLTKTMAEVKSGASNPTGPNAVLGSLPAGQAGIAAAAQMASDAPQMADILARDPLAAGGIPGLPAGFAQAVAYANTGIDPSVASDLSSLSVGPSGLTGSITPSLVSSASTISKGLSSIASFGGMMANPFGDRGGTPGVNGQPGTDNGAHGGVMGVAAAGADIAVGALAAVSEFKKGGARGALGGASAILGTAAALDPEPISKAILGIAAMGTSVVKGLLGDPRLARDRQETSELLTAKYTAPAPINLAIDSSGHAIDQNYKGQLRVLNALPTASLINQATGFGPETNTTGIGALLGLPQRPGDLITTQQRRLGLTQLPTAPAVTVQVQTMDSKSFNDNAHSIATAMQIALNNGHPVAGTIANKVRPI